MGRDYAGILGMTALVTVTTRGLVMSGSLESILPLAIAAMFLFAGLGWMIGTAAARIVDESVQQRINAELEALEGSETSSRPEAASAAKPAA